MNCWGSRTIFIRDIILHHLRISIPIYKDKTILVRVWCSLVSLELAKLRTRVQIPAPALFFFTLRKRYVFKATLLSDNDDQLHTLGSLVPEVLIHDDKIYANFLKMSAKYLFDLIHSLICGIGTTGVSDEKDTEWN